MDKIPLALLFDYHLAESQTKVKFLSKTELSDDKGNEHL